MSVDIQEKAEQILVDGFCVLQDQFPISAIEACNEAFALILRDYVAEHADKPEPRTVEVLYHTAVRAAVV